jgi:hypothetical protein
MVTCCQEWPLKCQVPTPGKAPGGPNTHTLDGLGAVTPVRAVLSACVGHLLATAHLIPFQRSRYPPARLMAQTSLAESALTAKSKPDKPRGSETACHFPCSHRAATGRPVAGLPLPPAPPTAQAAVLLGLVTAYVAGPHCGALIAMGEHDPPARAGGRLGDWGRGERKSHRTGRRTDQDPDRPSRHGDLISVQGKAGPNQNQYES